LEAATWRETDEIAKHEAGEELPAPHLLARLKADGQMESSTTKAVGTNQMDIVEYLHLV
jgi:hypothetical protein